MSETGCPVCGNQGRVLASDEGTCYFKPTYDVAAMVEELESHIRSTWQRMHACRRVLKSFDDPVAAAYWEEQSVADKAMLCALLCIRRAGLGRR